MVLQFMIFFFLNQLEQLCVWQADFIDLMNDDLAFWTFGTYMERKAITYKPSTLKSVAKKLSTQMLENDQQQTSMLKRIHRDGNNVWEKKQWDC